MLVWFIYAENYLLQETLQPRCGNPYTGATSLVRWDIDIDLIA